MYNEERKMRFISEKKALSTRENCISIFNAFEEFEDREDKDLCEFTPEDISDVLERRFRADASSLNAIFSTLRTYVRWCSGQGYPIANGVLDFDCFNTLPSKKISSCMVGSPEQLQEVLDEAFDPCELRTMDVVYRCYVWMAYMGIPKEDALAVTVDDVNLIKMQINFAGRHYKMYRESVEAFSIALNASDFNYVNSNYGVKMISRERKPGKYLLRGIRSAKLSAVTIDTVIKNHFKKTKVEYVHTLLFQSGLFYRTYEMECQGRGTDILHGWVLDELQMRESRRPDSKYIKKKKGVIERTIKKAYEDWKFYFRPKLN